MIHLGVVVIGYNQPDMMERLVQSIMLGKEYIPYFYFFLHSYNEGVWSVCARMDRACHARTYPFGYNRGIAKSWNDGILAAYADGADSVLVVNDDMEFGESGADAMAHSARLFPESPFHFSTGTYGPGRVPVRSHNFGCFVITKTAISRIGCFDENFFPATYEDLDYAQRAGMLGLSESLVNSGVWHAGSMTFLTDERLSARRVLTERLNREYYQRKWGSDYAFQSPFEDTRLGLFIAPEDKEHPYPGHNRTDYQEITTREIEDGNPMDGLSCPDTSTFAV